MTSTPSQSSTPAQSNSAASAAPSYASAAGSKKAPVVIHHGKSSSVSGRPPITPAVPSVQGVSSAAAGTHSRKSSLTIGNGSSYPGNANSNPNQKLSIKFGHIDSPVMSSESIQGRSAHSPAPPSPIPINAVSGGNRPPPIPPTSMTFGSLGNDDRMRQPPHNGNHGRRESFHSNAGSDMSQGHRQPHFSGQRGRPYHHPGGNGSFNNHHNQMGYPPNNYRGGGGSGGRGGMGYHNNGRGNMHIASSPQPGRSPRLSNSQMSTPNMPNASLAQPMSTQSTPHGYYPPPMQYGYGGPAPQQFGQHGVPGYQYNVNHFAGGPGAPSGFNPNMPVFNPSQVNSMSRSTSQHSEKTAQSPAIVGSTPAAGSSVFVRPNASSAIRITTPQGDQLDLNSVKSRNAAAAAEPVAAAATTPSKPPVKQKSPEEIQEELRQKIAQMVPSKKTDESKEKEEAEAKAKAEAETKAAADAKAAAEAKAVAEAKAAEEEKAKSAETKTETPSAEGAKNDEEDEMERMIREMEEADRLEAEREAKYAAEKAIKKAASEAKKLSPEEEDRKLREAEREMERLEEEKERRRNQDGPKQSFKELMAAARSGKEISTPAKADESVADKMSNMSLDPKVPKIEAPAGVGGSIRSDKNRKPAALNLSPLSGTKIEPPQPSAALQSLKSARFLSVMNQELYPAGILSPNPALNPASTKKGKNFQYDSGFLLQFKTVFTEQPSMEFQSQVKTLIGDDNRGGSARGQAPRAASSKGSSNPVGAPIGSAFGTGRVSVGGGMPRVSNNPMASFGGRGNFAMGRNASSNAPGSPRVNSNRAGRNNSNRPHKADKQAAAMPLTAGMEIKPIQISESGWKPTSVGQRPNAAAANGSLRDPAMVQRKVKAALNKMTPENFDRISEQILVIAGQSKEENDGRTLRQVIQLTFEKATDEAHWASMYARFCKRMLDTTSDEIRDDNVRDKSGKVVTGGTLFRKYLLNRCQEEFERGWKVNLPKPKEGEAEATLLSDEYYAAAAAKRRGLGLVQFIGELYKLGMLTDRIMHGCIQALVDFKEEPDESEVESLCKLLTTVGGPLESTPSQSRHFMNAYFERIDVMISHPGMNSRMKFMLMDVVDLRKNGWRGKEVNKGPKTLDEVRADAEAAAAAKAAEAAKMTRGGSGRPMLGHGDARHGYGGNNSHNSNQVSKGEFERLRSNKQASRSSTSMTSLGPGGSFGSRTNSARKTGGGNSMSRGSEDSASSSRKHLNSFDILASLDGPPNSPPSAAVSPALPKATPNTAAKEE